MSYRYKMRDEEFKILTFNGEYVDANLLEKGIYVCSKPFIYSKDETIENMAERARTVKDIAGLSFISEKYFDNLKQCKLEEIYLIKKNPLSSNNE